eukprot:GILK01001397.1.p1 GENE.GILK01001397.1~~GILK01001397.1.p1  ORF type:complete len:485 (-),score=94.72 GILK01001397.1:153-1607(-)
MDDVFRPKRPHKGPRPAPAPRNGTDSLKAHAASLSSDKKHTESSASNLLNGHRKLLEESDGSPSSSKSASPTPYRKGRYTIHADEEADQYVMNTPSPKKNYFRRKAEEFLARRKKKQEEAAANKASKAKKPKEPFWAEHLTLRIVVFSNLVMGPLTVALGVTATRLPADGILADKALIVFGVFVSVLAILGLVASLKRSDTLIITFVYLNITVGIFLCIFAISAIAFQDNIRAYVNDHWSAMQKDHTGETMLQVQDRIAKDISTVGAFALTTNLIQMIGIYVSVRIVPWEKMNKTLLPAFNVNHLILGSVLIGLGVYIGKTANVFPEMSLWSNTMVTALGACVIVLSMFGFHVGRNHNKKQLLYIYTVALVVCAIALFIAGIGSFFLAEQAEENTRAHWAEISSKLADHGQYDVSEQAFASNLKTNLLYAGLVGVVSFIFLLVGIIPAIAVYRHIDPELPVALTELSRRLDPDLGSESAGAVSQ